MKTIYIITVDTRHGTDNILVTSEPTHMDLGLIENYYLKAYDLKNVHVEYYMAMPVNEIPKSVTHYIAQQEYITISSRAMDQL
jgi:hypothetical protein